MGAQQHAQYRWRLLSWLLGLWWLSMSGMAQAQNLALELSPEATHQMTRRGSDVTLTIRNNRTNVRDQLERLRTQTITGMLVLSGAEGELIVRMSLAPGVNISDRRVGNPPRLLLNLESGGQSSQASSRPAPTRAGRTTARGSSAQPDERRPLDAGAVSGSTGRMLTFDALAQLPLLEALGAVIDEAEPPRRPADLEGQLLCIGSRVMYPVNLPDYKLSLESWNAVTIPGAVGAEAELIQRGLDLLADAHPGEAETELRKFEKRFPQSPRLNDVRYLTVQARFANAEKSGRSSLRLEAMERLRDQLRLDPKNYNRVRLLYIAGRTYQDLKYHHEASTMFRDALAGIRSDDPNRHKVLVALGWSDYKRYANDDALLVWRTAMPLLSREQQSEIMMALASLMAQKGTYNHVRNMLALVRQHFPENVQTVLFRVLEAESLYRLDQFQESRIIYEKLRAELSKDVPRLYEYRIGEALMVEQRFKEARRLFLAPSLESTSDKRKWQEAMQALRNLQMDMIADKDSETRLQSNLSKLQILRTDNPYPPIAEEADLEFIKYYVGRGNLIDALGLLKNFMAAYSKNTLARPVLDLVWKRVQERLKMFYDREQYFEMLGLYEVAYPIVSAAGAYDSDVTYLVTRAYMNMGLFDLAYKTISEGFFIEGSSRILEDQSLLMLSEIQRGQGKYDDALRALSYLRSNSQKPESLKLALLEEGRVHEKAGNPIKAADAYRQFGALEQDPILRVRELTRAGIVMTSARGCEGGTPLLKNAVQMASQVKDPKLRAQVADPYYRYGECLYTLKQYQQVPEVMRDAINRDPVHPLITFARYAIAKSYLGLKREKDGELLLRMLSEERTRLPDDPWVRMATEEIEQLTWQRSLTGTN